MKKLYEKYHHALPVNIYFIVYMAWFGVIESRKVTRYTVIHMSIDDKIPFCELFVIPYFIWFGYVAWIVGYTFLKDKRGYYNVATFLMTGMTIFLIISTFFPNVQRLRPYVMPRDNVFAHMVRYLYKIDTPTNLWPSIHVYNSLGVYFAVVHDKRLGGSKFAKNTSLVLTTLIILSTLFLKQHSMFDVLTAFIMAAVVYVLVYRLDVIVSLRYSYGQRKQRKAQRFGIIK